MRRLNRGILFSLLFVALLPKQTDRHEAMMNLCCFVGIFLLGLVAWND